MYYTLVFEKLLFEIIWNTDNMQIGWEVGQWNIYIGTNYLSAFIDTCKQYAYKIGGRHSKISILAADIWALLQTLVNCLGGRYVLGGGVDIPRWQHLLLLKVRGVQRPGGVFLKVFRRAINDIEEYAECNGREAMTKISLKVPPSWFTNALEEGIITTRVMHISDKTPKLLYFVSHRVIGVP